jgi:hypothetical protein
MSNRNSGSDQQRGQQKVHRKTKARGLLFNWAVKLKILLRRLCHGGTRPTKTAVRSHAPLNAFPRESLQYACLYGLTGRYDEARRYWQETQLVNPNFSVERLGQILPYRNPSQLGRLVDGLRNAGIAV